jgi:acyl-[acyl-carrier-protein]-phospholipid O-acyltransferase/long-chain-fatty-acid--[acyl-carrier-protein] ligase
MFRVASDRRRCKDTDFFHSKITFTNYQVAYINKTNMKIIYEKGAKALFRLYFRFFHNITIEGMENIPKNPDKLIIIANHESLLDGLIIWTYLDLKFKIVVDRVRAQELLLKPFMQNTYTIQIDSMNPYSLKGVIEKLNKGIPLLIFPEGRVTRTGGIMKIYEGTGFAAYKTGARILPVYLKNTFSTIFSKKQGKKKIFTPVAMSIGEVHEPINLEALPPRNRKKAAASIVYNILCNASYEAHNKPSTLGYEFIYACKKHRNRILYRDAAKREISYRKALTGAFILGRHLSDIRDKNIGMLLPNLTVTALIFMGLQLFRKVPVFLNYSSGPGTLKYAMELGDLHVIVTSRKFIETIKLDPAVFEGKRLVFIDDLNQKIHLGDKLLGLWKSVFPGTSYRVLPDEHKETAVILYTSGSEGLPKGVCLSHENIISNIHQSLSKIDLRETDYLLNALPMFHSFGLTVGTILPMFAGAKVFLYVSPLHYRIIPEIAYDEGCTILMGTNTFLNGFSKKAHPYDFHTMRYIFCGAETLSDTVFEKYAKAYGIRVMSGYGVTECSPVISINNALEHEYGTVGKMLPGIEHKLMPVEGVDSRNGHLGRLYVKGKNVMKGYLKNEKANRKYLIEDEGWYDTGDIVEVTEDGFLRIAGRLRRFSKISGEMISLTAIEEALTKDFGDRKDVAVMAVADERKGEKLILITNNGQIELKTARERLKTRGFSELACPKDIRFIKEIPKLGTGKVDYMKLKEML